MTKGLLNCIKKRKDLYKNHLSSKTDLAENKYKVYRNTLQRILRKAKQDYFTNQCVTFKSNTKKLWKIINSITRKTTDKTSIIESIKVKNIEHFDGKIITSELGKYFSSVGSSFAYKIKPSKKPIENYVNNIQINTRSVFLTPCNRDELNKLIHKLPNKKSAGYDSVSNVLLKDIKDPILPPLLTIFNNSLANGIFPEHMKHAEIAPLYKNRPKNQTTNYRPISLLITILKILEKVMYSRIYQFLNEDQIYISQYGFCSNHSCENAVTELISNIVKGWETKKSTLAVYLDLSKAFDTLEHTVLFNKLESYGIRGSALDWFKSYLSNRTMSVKCKIKSSGNVEFSDHFIVNYGTPQGSCLGPLLFLIFSNDLHKVLENCCCILFADDTTIYFTHENHSYLQWNIIDDLNRLADWFRANKLTLNLKKTVCMLFSPKRLDRSVLFEINDVAIPLVDHTKFLGVWLDNSLKWNYHINNLVVKLKRNLNMLKEGCNTLNKHVMKMIYYAQIYSHIVYGISLWGNHVPTEVVNKLQKLQNKCLCYILNKNAINNNDYNSLEILQIEEIIKLETVKFAYKINKSLLSDEIMQCVHTDQHGNSLKKVHSYNTRFKNIPYKPKATSSQYLNSLICRCNTDFLSLKDITRESATLSSFNIRCRKELLSNQA